MAGSAYQSGARPVAMRNAFAAVREKAAAAAAEAAAVSREALKEARAAAKETVAEATVATRALRGDVAKVKEALVTKVKEAKEAQQHRRSMTDADAPAGATCVVHCRRPRRGAHTPAHRAEGGEAGDTAAERVAAGVSPTGAPRLPRLAFECV